MHRDLLKAIQAYTARSAITSSSMRGASQGTIAAGRQFLSNLPLGCFGTRDASTFRSHLDHATDKLLSQLPSTARHWGRARRGLNIFLRGCLYTSYVRDTYALALAEDYFEIPLDRITGARLCHEVGGLPRWKSVQSLDVATSDAYQAAAARVAKRQGHARVHLDALWWGLRL